MNVLELQNVTVDYRTRAGKVRAVDGVSLAVPRGATLGLVGESGCGKSSLARAIVGLIPSAAGRLRLASVEYELGRRHTTRAVRGHVQMVFQDHVSSLNPRMTVSAILREALQIHRPQLGRRERRQESARLLDTVLLDPAAMPRYPHEFSGGQRQRIALARALAAGPDLLIADEITSALDVSVQATVLNLLREIQNRLGVSYMFISHNLAAVRYMSDVVAVMYMGRVVEYAASVDLFRAPQHPYTRGLVASVLGTSTHGADIALGELPDLHDPPSGCRYHTRCIEGPLVRTDRSICREQDPQTAAGTRAHRAACHFATHSTDAAMADRAEPIHQGSSPE